MTIENVDIVDNISADSIAIGDQIIIDGDMVEVKSVNSDTDDIDEVIVSGYSHNTGDNETYSLFADDYFDVWAV